VIRNPLANVAASGEEKVRTAGSSRGPLLPNIIRSRYDQGLAVHVNLICYPYTRARARFILILNPPSAYAKAELCPNSDQSRSDPVLRRLH
jgi:hypothetical protein